MIKKSVIFAFLIACLSLTAVFAQSDMPKASSIVKKDLSSAEIDRIIKKFTENEKLFHEALTNYVFNRLATVQTIGMGGQVTGEYRRDSFMSLGQDGSRFEKVLFAPIATTPPGMVTPEDLEDLGGVTPFALEPSAVSQYNFSYVGVEHIDELDLYVFDVTPKEIPDPKKTKLRLFTGRIWVDKSDFMIVKSKGKAVPETNVNKFPIVETFRENIDGKYWFPTYAYANDTLFFDKADALHIRMKVKYTDYKVGHSDVKILDDVPDAKPTPTPTPKKP